jgi:CelD/BcsL family acetyltransferase involved in cellulose biosynthesis
VAEVVVRERIDQSEEWDALLERAALRSPFLRSWWLNALAGPKSSIVLVVDAGVMIGGIALEIGRVAGIEELRLTGHELAPDHCDLLAAPGREDEVVGAVKKWVERPGQRRFVLEGVAEQGLLLRALPGSPNSSVLDVAPWHPLPASYAAYVQSRRKNFRRNARRCRHLLTERGFTYRCLPPADVEFGLRELRRLHGLSLGDRSSFLPHFEGFARAAREGVRRGEIFFHGAFEGRRAVVIEVMFEVAGRLSTYQGGRDPSDPRTSGLSAALIGHAVERAIMNGCEELDMLRGGQEFKREWAAEERSILRVEAASGVIATSLDRCIPILKSLRGATVGALQGRS